MEEGNAPEVDQDVVLEKSAKGDLPSFEKHLKSFLWTNGGHEVKGHVRVRDADALVAVLEQFQEQPQLLDPYLQNIVPPLAVAFIHCLQYPPTTVKSSTISHLLTPLSAAICRLLYTFCKIRGEKVIVRFLSTETKHLELLLSAIESGISVDDSTETLKRAWCWEERYATLLWLSQLLLAPFDLESISSISADEDGLVEVSSNPEFTYPEKAPRVARRVISLALRHLSSSGREREAAKLLLVRIALRPDMQQIGTLDALVRWAMKTLCDQSDVVKPVHHYIGVLSFLAGLLGSSTGTNDMDRYLGELFSLVEQVQPDGDPVFRSIHESAVARKSVIKIYRGVATLLLRTNLDEEGFSIVQGAIVALLGFLADDSTPVRLSASKALSMVVPKLDSDMSMQVVQAIVDELEAGISWHKPEPSTKFADSQKYSFQNANVLLWHGHVLTLSQLLYRRAIPVTEISSVLVYVVAGLSFEKRDVSGLSVGTNVRDAACFGVWALARRYTTAELKSAHLQGEHATAYRVHSDELGTLPAPVVQQLAIELIVSACLDPAGNIRRGSSAALQELVGRHPDAIVNGISLVQVIDYHAIARRSTALHDVAFSAANLSSIYFDAIISALLGWRGVRDVNPSVRRDVAKMFGQLTWSRQLSTGSSGLSENLEAPVLQLLQRHNILPSREFHERHGLLLCVAAVMDGFQANQISLQSILGSMDSLKAPVVVKSIMSSVQHLLLTADQNTKDRKPTELFVESVCSLILSTFPLIRANILLAHWETLRALPGNFDVSKVRRDLLELCDIPLWPPKTAYNPDPALKNMQTAIDGGFFEDREIVSITRRLLKHFVNMKEPETIEVVSRTCSNYIFLLDRAARELLVQEWIGSLEIGVRIGRAVDGKTISQILFYVLPILAKEEGDDTEVSSPRQQATKQLHAKWLANKDNDTRVWLLRCLRCTNALQTFAKGFITWLEDGLNDYTITSQGDVGRHVRIEALKTVTGLGTSYDNFYSNDNLEVYLQLFGLVLRSAAEKNDSVREAAKEALIIGIPPSFQNQSIFADLSPKSQLYFQILLQLPSISRSSWALNWILLMQGYVTSAHAGSEDIINVSRAALASACRDDSDELTQAISNALFKLLRDKMANDRIIVSVLEVIAFLFDAGIMHQLEHSKIDSQISIEKTWVTLCALVQQAHYKSNEVRRIEAAVRIYGSLAECCPPALKKLSSMLLHPFPKIRDAAVEELFALYGVGKGIDWSKATSNDVSALMAEVSAIRDADTTERTVGWIHQ